MTHVPCSDSVCVPAAHAELPDARAQTAVASTETMQPAARIVPLGLSHLPAFLIPASGE
ncbi:hypothetical protein [Caballeronia sp. 15711]|uniref:hypothetical protein n=1 Tax=Caballeronia sp. 15711 TaxID=3391029 RepID=UPI0039E5710E